MEYFLDKIISIKSLLVVFLCIAACNNKDSGGSLWGLSSSYPYYSEKDLQSICLESVPGLPRVVSQAEEASVTKVLVLPNRFRQFVAGFVNEFAKGLESKGWKVVDYEAAIAAQDPLEYIKRETGFSRKPDIVAFYLVDWIEAVPFNWENLSTMGTIRLFIIEDLHSPHTYLFAREISEKADAVFARYPEAFTKVVHPKRPMCFPLYHGASEYYFEAAKANHEKINKALLSGSIVEGFYPLRFKAKRLVEQGSKIIVQRPFPGYDIRLDPVKEAKDYAKDMASYEIGISGAGMGLDLPAPYILAKHFEIPASGTVLLTDHFLAEQLKKIGFIDGVHYLSATPETLKNVVSTWLRPENKDKLNEIARAGHKLVQNQHSINHRVEQFHTMALQIYFKQR